MTRLRLVIRLWNYKWLIRHSLWKDLIRHVIRSDISFLKNHFFRNSTFLRTYQLDQFNRNTRSEFLNATTTLPNYVIWNNRRSQIKLHLHKKMHMYFQEFTTIEQEWAATRAIMAQATKHWPLLKTYFTPFLCVYDRGAGATCAEAVHCCWPPWLLYWLRLLP